MPDERVAPGFQRSAPGLDRGADRRIELLQRLGGGVPNPLRPLTHRVSGGLSGGGGKLHLFYNDCKYFVLGKVVPDEFLEPQW